MDRKLEFLNRINYEHPGLEKAGEYKNSGNEQKCLEEVIKYFRNRKAPYYLFDVDDMKKFDDKSVLDDAEKVLNHYIFGYQFEGDIDWHFNPTEETSRDNEWTWSLFRNIYWQPLARAYVMTGDEKYAKEFVSQLNSFIEAWPAKRFLEDDTFELKTPFPGHAWRTIETAMRVYTTWLPCFYAFRNSKSFDDESIASFLVTLCDHADFLMGHYSNHNRSSNWLTMESSALLQCGIMFPEFKSDWFITGYQRVMHEIRYSFDNDGVHMERTPIYHMVATIVYLQAYRLCKINKIEVAPYALETLVKAAEFIMRLVKSDFSTPMIGDADRNDLLARKSDTSIYEGMNLSFDPYDLNEMRGFFRTMYELTQREDFLYFATGREKGKAPKQRNYKMQDAGVYIMRTGWEKQDTYFHIHGVSLERGEKSTHSHNDQGHLELQIKGEDILTDSGRFIYNSSCWKNWRHYFLSACAHNTLYVDDHEMGTVPGVTRVRGVRTYCHKFEETKQYQLIDVSHNGYVYTDDPIYHRRKVIRLPEDVFIIDDMVTGLGLSEHDIRLYFNFAPGNLENAEENNYQYTTKNGTKYSMTSLNNKGITSHVLEGSEDPIGGWISYGYPVRQPIPQVYFATKGPVPVHFVTVIAPVGIEVTGNVSDDKVLVTVSEEGRTKQCTITDEYVLVEKAK